MSDISEDVFKPKVKETCSFDEALEILAFGWLPVDDETLLDEVRVRYSHFYYIIDYFHVASEWDSKNHYLRYSKNYDKYYSVLPHLNHRIETTDELEYYKMLKKSLAIMRRVIATRPSEMTITCCEVDSFEYFDIDSSEVKQLYLKTVWYETLEIYGNEIRGVFKDKEYELIINFKTDYIYNLYKKKLEHEHVNDDCVQIHSGSKKTIDDTYYTTPEIKLINAFIEDSKNIPLLEQRGQKNVAELKSRLIKLNNELKLIEKLTDNQIKGILSVIKAPDAKRTGAIPTPCDDL